MGMNITFDTASAEKVKAHMDDNKQLLLTFEDGVGKYSQHAMIHMQVQFTINIVDKDAPVEGYNAVVHSNIGDLLIKDYSAEDLEENMSIKFNAHQGTLQLSGDGGLIDDNVGFIDFTDKNGIKNNPAK
ncbi:hypothetical protein IV80_GL001886 [Pediococcus cellicola]|uniref:Core domain-containing protein n=2 Tax=Pediococcus cellicola TaxID=319652 RepID=A0A0R2IV17_9LACO|nr:hypothetical protein IV80_GL001886 [Pediococcus cellicola]GEL15645.1 hypothetical protein PCE01_14470 [Pediococcus cellicola]